MTRSAGSLFAGLAPAGPQEELTQLLATPGLRIERIVSHGHASPPGFWYDQPWAEWVCVLAGSAGVRFEEEAQTRRLQAGDWLGIPARARHRVEWTDPQERTIWLAVHHAP